MSTESMAYIEFINKVAPIANIKIEVNKWATYMHMSAHLTYCWIINVTFIA